MTAKTIAQLYAAVRTAGDDLDVDEMDAAADALCAVAETHGVVLTAGNGGSNSTASHFAADLTKFTRVPGRPHLRAVALSDNIACHTAWANDDDPAMVSMHLAEPWLQCDESARRNALVVFSVHGGARDGSVSSNLVELTRYGLSTGATVIAVTGFDGGAVGDLADVHVNVPMRSEPLATPGVESLHLLIAHALCLRVRERRSTSDV